MIVWTIVNTAIQVYLLMLLANVVSSWLPELRDQEWMRFILFYTDPYLDFFRRFIPPLGPLDISPIIAFLALQFAQSFLRMILLSV